MRGADWEMGRGEKGGGEEKKRVEGQRGIRMTEGVNGEGLGNRGFLGWLFWNVVEIKNKERDFWDGLKE